MLLNITNRCKMQCPHCFSNCLPEGTDVSMEILDETISFINNNELRFRVILITGGEPTEHPLLFDILDKLYKTNIPNQYGEKKVFILATNGMFLNMSTSEDDNKIVMDYADRLLSYENLRIQITADPRFYKTKLNERNLKYLYYANKGRASVFMEKNIGLLANFGRATINQMPRMPKRKSPYCFNARSITNSGFSFQKLVEYVETEMMKFCVISFDMTGNIRISESLVCPTVGTIWTPLDELSKSIKHMRCRKCSLVDSLPSEHKKAIGML